MRGIVVVFVGIVTEPEREKGLTDRTVNSRKLQKLTTEKTERKKTDATLTFGSH